MTITTQQASLRKPELSDQPNAYASVGNLADDVDKVVIPVFATAAARDVKITTPTGGMHCYITDTAVGGRALYQYTGSAWVRMQREPLFAYKPTFTNRASTTTLADDPDLFLSVEANAVYLYTGMFIVQSGASGDFKMNMSWPTGASVTYGGVGPSNELVTSNTSAYGKFATIVGETTSPGTAIAYAADASVNPWTILQSGLVVMGVTSGSFKMRWAQVVSSGTVTTLSASSYIKLERVG